MVGLFAQAKIRHVADHDAMAGGRLYIYLVDPGTEPRNGPTARELRYHRRWHLG